MIKIMSQEFIFEEPKLTDEEPLNSRKKHSKEELEEQLRAAQRLGYVGGSVRKLAHELRNPLNTIYLNLQLLEEDCKKYQDEKLLRRLNTSIKEVQRLNHLLSEFLEFARTSITELKPMDINPVIRDFLEFVAPSAERDKVKLASKLASNLPWVLLDEKLFRSVLMNLYLNSVAAMPEGGTITIRTRRRKNRVLLTLTDTGCGIPEDVLNHVFDIFFTTKSGGSGIGLSLTRRAIEDMGGSITIDSTPGSGTTILISLPIALIPVKKPSLIPAESELLNP